MRDDQRVRLEELSDTLTEVVLEEADPKSWPGEGIPLDAMSKDERGDRYWCKKNAAATLALLTKLHTVLDRAAAGVPADEGDDMEDEIRKAEKEAGKRLKLVTAHGKKTG